MRLAGSFAVAVLAIAALLAPRPAEAIPVFAHRYGLTCQACHTIVPHLTPFGEAFLAGGYRLPAARTNRPFPAAIKVNLEYAGDPDDSGLPKAVVDEVEVLLGGSLGPRGRGAYFAEQYVVDGGLPGRKRDLWASWRATPDGAKLPLWLRGGQFTLDLPVDPETFRETTDHYAIWDQTAGDNPFSFFEPKTGLALSAGREGRGLHASFAAVQGHDPGSGLPARGIDRHLFVQQQAGDGLTLSAYRYDGTRPVDGLADRFWREGYGLGFERGRARFDAVYQRGFDTHASTEGGLRSSGAFAQVRYELSPRAFALARYDGTQDAERARAVTAGLGFRVARNARLTVFDTVHHDADDGARRNSLSAALLFAY
ncbi:MAG: hypothetical protein QOI11_1804 [Candidatus Eremiobacteraeota bacterium]|nr:hypothetical protein [Candidatus Eremiobacteraeota bacterium]